MSVLLFIGVEMGTFLSVAEELWQEPKDLAGAFAGAQRFLRENNLEQRKYVLNSSFSKHLEI